MHYEFPHLWVIGCQIHKEINSSNSTLLCNSPFPFFRFVDKLFHTELICIDTHKASICYKRMPTDVLHFHYVEFIATSSMDGCSTYHFTCSKYLWWIEYIDRNATIYRTFDVTFRHRRINEEHKRHAHVCCCDCSFWLIITYGYIDFSMARAIDPYTALISCFLGASYHSIWQWTHHWILGKTLFWEFSLSRHTLHVLWNFSNTKNTYFFHGNQNPHTHTHIHSHAINWNKQIVWWKRLFEGS